METTVVKGMGKCPKLPWMIEFHSTADGKIFNNQLKSAFAPTFLLHQSNLQEKSKVRRKRLTQLVVPLPPKIKLDEVEGYLKAGMTVALIRLEYFQPEDVPEVISILKTVNEEFGKKVGRVYPLAVAVDIPDPEIRIGKLQKPLTSVELEKGDTTKVLSNPEFKNCVSKDYIYVNYDNISNVMKPGDSLIVGDDVELSVTEIVKDILLCIIERAGLLSDNLSVKLPNVPVISSNEIIARERLQELKECDLDMVFVGPKTVPLAKEILGSTVLIFGKVENEIAVRDFDVIAASVDGVLVDGDKLLPTSMENVFLVQKAIIANCLKMGKPVIASHNCHTLTKAQVDDIANTIIDGVDGLLLPPDPELLESVTLVCKSAEAAIYQLQLFQDLVSLHPPPIEPITSVAIAAVQASFNSNAAAIILLTTSGRSAKLISRFRPRCPIIALTRFGRIAKQLMIYRGVIPIFYVRLAEDSFQDNVEKRMQMGMTFGKVQGYIRMGDAVVLVFGTKNHVGFRNCVEVVFASEYDTVPDEEVDD